jgi:hypothetical protein
VLYFALTGRLPFDATTFVELSANPALGPPTPRTLDPGINVRLRKSS